MSGQGYPDFIRNVQQIGTPLVNVTGVQAEPTKVYGPFSVGVWAALDFYMQTVNDTTEYFLTFEWFSDEAMTQGSGYAVYSMIKGPDAVDYVLNLGPWVRVTVECNAAAGAAGFELRVTPMMTPNKRSRTDLFGALLAVQSESIAPLALFRKKAFQVSAGQASWSVVSEENVDYIAFLHVHNGILGDLIIDEMRGTSSSNQFSPSRLIEIPSGSLEVSILNNHATLTGHFSSAVILDT